MLRFAHPLWLILLVVPLFNLFSYFRKKGGGDATVLFSDVSVFKTIGTGTGKLKRLLSLFIVHVTVVVLILAMARPQSGKSFHTRTARGVDIILAMDISSSMAAMDFHPLTRFEAAKEVVIDFIGNRHSDRIGLIVFSAQSFTLCPLTLDYDMLTAFLDRAWESRIEDGTAIGSAIATSINRLRDSDAKSKIIILLTDGMNNRGNIDPQTAARLAETLNIKIYTIGVGSEGRAMFKMNGRPFWTETHIDEASLKEVAESTGGKYYHAKNTQELKGIYDEINQLETTKIEYKEWIEYDEKFGGFMKAGFLLLILSFVLDRTVLRRLP
ncbi:MAG: VWA domain-containing protein [Candidatus Latescibacteria bacterium]|nr:VWA domain-containing protein [Candidatus Latescibacterota bacterium]